MKAGNLDVDIREMVIDDLPLVFHLGEKLFTPEEFSNLYRTWDEYEVTYLFQTEPEFCLVATIDDKLAGFALGYTVEKPRTAWDYGHLVWLGVDEPYQRHGLATKLFEEFMEIMQTKGVRIMVVDTQANNKGAIHFFKKHGFDNPIKHVYMSLNLDEVSREKGR